MSVCVVTYSLHDLRTYGFFVALYFTIYHILNLQEASHREDRAQRSDKNTQYEEYCYHNRTKEFRINHRKPLTD